MKTRWTESFGGRVEVRVSSRFMTAMILSINKNYYAFLRDRIDSDGPGILASETSTCSPQSPDGSRRRRHHADEPRPRLAVGGTGDDGPGHDAVGSGGLCILAAPGALPADGEMGSLRSLSQSSSSRSPGRLEFDPGFLAETRTSPVVGDDVLRRVPGISLLYVEWDNPGGGRYAACHPDVCEPCPGRRLGPQRV